MSDKFPLPPPTGAPMLAARASRQARTLLALRRSVGKRALMAPGPHGADLDELLRVAARVPDHRRLAPWRFIVFEGAARARFDEAAASIHALEHAGASVQEVADAAAPMSRAPVVVAIVSSPDPGHKTPVWEQELSVGAVCQNLLLAANASGWAGCWLTEWISYSPGIKTLMALGANERLAGFVYLGTASEQPQERMRPDMAGRISRWPA